MQENVNFRTQCLSGLQRAAILRCASEHVALLSCGTGVCADYKVPYASIYRGLAIMGTQGFSALLTLASKT